jgi:hypothetical protein
MQSTMLAARPETAVPVRTIQQRRDALENANRVRVRRAQLKRDLKAGRASVHEILLDPPAWVETMPVFDLLLAVPNVGRSKANKMTLRHRVSPSKTIGGLTVRQRAELLAALPPYGSRR